MRAISLLFATLLTLTGCAQALSPRDVADRFWRAVVTQHPDKIKRYVRAADQAALEHAPELLPVTSFELGRVVIDDLRAQIETRIELGGDEPVKVPLDTVLVHENDGWRVDYQTTVAAISANSELARVMQQIEKIGEALKQGIDRSVGDLKNVLPRVEDELSRIESEIKQRVPELRERLEEFSRRLEESLKERPAKPAPPSDGTIAI